MKTVAACSTLLALLCLLGCSGGSPLSTPEGRKDVVKEAGEIAALAYLSTAKPTAEEVAAINTIVTKISKSLTAYKDGGFVTALPEIEKVIDDNLPGDDKMALRQICKKAVNILVEELDRVFVRHPEWKSLSEEIAGMTAAFFEGASGGLSKYKQPAA